MDTKPCIQKRLLNSAKSNKWGVVIFFQLGLSFAMSLFFFLIHPLEGYRVSTDLSKSLLSSLIDVFIALFGFVGLILVFIFGNLLTVKGQLEKERFEVESKRREFEVRMEFEETPRLKGSQANGLVKQVRKNLDDRIIEIGNRLTRNKKQIQEALFSGTMAIGTAVTCILINIWAFGDIINETEGMHFLNITILLSLFFLCIDFIFKGIKTVINQE